VMPPVPVPRLQWAALPSGQPRVRVPAGSGRPLRAGCSCGAMSPAGLNHSGRREWVLAHKRSCGT